jgi:hypothetical protein
MPAAATPSIASIWIPRIATPSTPGGAGLSLERIMSDMRTLPFKDEVWPKFLRDNARKVLKLDR